MKLNECRLWTGREEVYYCGLPVPVKSVGTVDLEGSVDIESDRRFIQAISAAGIPYLLYRSPTGFRVIRPVGNRYVGLRLI